MRIGPYKKQFDIGIIQVCLDNAIYFFALDADAAECAISVHREACCQAGGNSNMVNTIHAFTSVYLLTSVGIGSKTHYICLYLFWLNGVGANCKEIRSGRISST